MILDFPSSFLLLLCISAGYRADEDVGDWDNVNSWTWKADFEMPPETGKAAGSTDWIQRCVVAMCKQSQILVLARADRFTVLSSKWERVDDREVRNYRLAFPANYLAQSSGYGNNRHNPTENQLNQ